VESAVLPWKTRGFARRRRARWRVRLPFRVGSVRRGRPLSSARSRWRRHSDDVQSTLRRDATRRSMRRVRSRRDSSKSSLDRSRVMSRRTGVRMAIRPASPHCSIDLGFAAVAGPGVEDPFPARLVPRARNDRVRRVPIHARDALVHPVRADAESVPPSPRADRAPAFGRRSILPQLGARPKNGRRSLRKFF